jgi:hypothetical protein
MLARFGFYSYLCSGNKVFHIQEWKRRRLRVSRVCNSERRITYKARSPALWAFCFCPKHGRTLRVGLYSVVIGLLRYQSQNAGESYLILQYQQFNSNDYGTEKDFG